jgi:hypothetical protein
MPAAVPGKGGDRRNGSFVPGVPDRRAFICPYLSGNIMYRAMIAAPIG